NYPFTLEARWSRIAEAIFLDSFIFFVDSLRRPVPKRIVIKCRASRIYVGPIREARRATTAPDAHSYRLDRIHTRPRRPRHIAGRVHRACRNDLWGRGRHFLALVWLRRRRLLLVVPVSVRRTAGQAARNWSISKPTHGPRSLPNREKYRENAGRRPFRGA